MSYKGQNNHSLEKLISYWLFLCSFTCAITFIELTPKYHHMILYYSPPLQFQSHVDHKLVLVIDFTSSQFKIDPKYKDHHIFIDKHTKNNKSLNGHMNIKYGNVHKKPLSSHSETASQELERQEQIDGVIGLNRHNNSFYRALKTILGTQQLKLWFRIYENKVEIIKQDCHNPLFPPYRIDMFKQPSIHQYAELTDLSMNFYPKVSQALILLQKKHNPFIATREDMKTTLSIEFLNEAQRIPIKFLLVGKCLKVAGSDNYECDVTKDNMQINTSQGRRKPIEDLGRLLLEFDPIVCTDQPAIELQQSDRSDGSVYYWLHILLLIVQVGGMIIYRHKVSCTVQTELRRDY